MQLISETYSFQITEKKPKQEQQYTVEENNIIKL